jgi:hypothetical protein
MSNLSKYEVSLILISALVLIIDGIWLVKILGILLSVGVIKGALR